MGGVMGNEDLLAALKTRLQTKQWKDHGICDLCGEANPLALKTYEDHHLSTKAYDPHSTIPLCLNCHATVTYQQNNIAPKLRSKKLPLQERHLFVLLTHNALRKRMAEVEERIIKEIYEGQHGHARHQSIHTKN